MTPCKHLRMPSIPQSHKLGEIASDLWRIRPDLVAEKLSGGKFKRYRHIEFISRQIARAVTKGNGRIIISAPPRHGKSWLTSLWTPVWFLSLFPDRNVILTSYEAEFASSWGRLVRNTIAEHPAELSVSLAEDSQAAGRWHTDRGGGMITAGVGGPITGRGGHLIIIDDPVKNWEDAQSPTMRKRAVDWYQSTLHSRVEPNATILLLMTRWHEADLAGWLLSGENEAHADWTEIKIPAIAEEKDPLGRAAGEALCSERYDIEKLNGLKRAVGSQKWAALYQQRPSAQEGNIIRREWIRFYTGMPEKLEEWIESWDLTFTAKANSDFVVGQVWGRKGAQKFLLDQVRARMGITDTIAALTNLSRKWPQATLKLIENKANGPAVQDLLKAKVSGLVLWEPVGDKVARLNAVAPQFEAGNVFLPHPSHAPWINEWIEEVVTFPNGANDDQVDAASMGLIRLEDSNSRAPGLIRVVR